MLIASLVCFALAAAGGSLLIYMHLSQKSAPVGIAALHGLAALSGLILLVTGMAQGHTGRIFIAALSLFVIAALGGLILFAMHLRSRPLPVPILVMHALVAVAGLLTLLAGVTGYGA